MTQERLGLAQALRTHWPEYLMEAWGLGMFMVSAGLFATLLEYPGSPLRAAIPDDGIRLGLMGLAMGLTAIAIIYSPWGKRSGAHINPAVTLGAVAAGDVSTVVEAMGSMGATRSTISPPRRANGTNLSRDRTAATI